VSTQLQFLPVAFRATHNHLFLHILVLSQRFISLTLIILTKISPVAFAIQFSNAHMIKTRSMDLPYFTRNERIGSLY